MSSSFGGAKKGTIWEFIAIGLIRRGRIAKGILNSESYGAVVNNRSDFKPTKGPSGGCIGSNPRAHHCVRMSISLSLLITLACSTAGGANPPAAGGYVAGNATIAAQINDRHGMIAHIKVNPPVLGTWLKDFATQDLWLTRQGKSPCRLRLRLVRSSRLYPEYDAVFSAKGGVELTVHTFAPLGLNPDRIFIPALITTVKLHAPRAWRGSIGLTLTRADATDVDGVSDAAPEAVFFSGKSIQKVKTDQVSGIVNGGAFLAMQGGGNAASASSTDSGLEVRAPVDLRAHQDRRLVFIVGDFDKDGAYFNAFLSARSALLRIVRHVRAYDQGTQAFNAALPKVGDREIDKYLHWYVSAAVLLTKANREGDVLTMGYRELNQRDSFWTSGLHLVFWPKLERRMIEESVLAQLPSGRIPVTILPVIDRGDEIDSDEYFILRVARDYDWYRDRSLLNLAWPAVKRAIEDLKSRDKEGVGVPMQTSYWADWKDVPGVEGRKYAPHFVLLWIAALDAARHLADALGDRAAAAQYSQIRVKAYDFANRPTSEGGMWNGRTYVELWSDGRNADYVREDQLVGAYFGVIPQDRLRSIYAAIKANETPWGVRETFPYIANWREADGGTPGNYHNGGIWPWINFMDAGGRYASGRAKDAERIIRKVGAADLATGDDDKPGEYLNGDFGDNRGFPVQGWDADLFSVLYFKALGVRRLPNGNFAVRPRLGRRSFKTMLLLPGLAGTLEARQGSVNFKAFRRGPGAPRVRLHASSGTE